MRLIISLAALVVVLGSPTLVGCSSASPAGSPSPAGESVAVGHGTVVFNGAVYFRQEWIDVPPEDAQRIGTADAIRFDMTSDPAVFSVGDFDPAIAILLRDTTGQGGYHLFMTDNAKASDIRARYGQ